MTDPKPFDMPSASAGFDVRGGWLVKRLADDFSLTLTQAAGLVGNLGYESEGFAALQEIAPISGRGGRGWPMWTGSRRVAFEAWCKTQKLDPSSDQANYGYLCHDLQGDYKHTIQALKSETSLANAVFSVGQTYERPSGTTATFLPGESDRITWARRALAGAQMTIVEKPVATPTPSKPIAAGATAREVQQRLVDLGWHISVDGVDGPQTWGAVMAALEGLKA